MTNSGITPSPRTSVIILSYNGMDHLPECFKSLSAQTDRDMELIAVDNASSDGSAEWIRHNHPSVTLIPSRKNRGYCGGMNLGITHASGRYVLLLNQDVVLEPECVERLADALDTASGTVAGAFPMVRFYYVPGFINAFGVNWYETCHWRDSRVGLADLGQYQDVEPVFGSIFPAVMFRRESFAELGGFDELFWSYCEDFDICYRANIMGYQLVGVPNAVLYHKYRASSKDESDPLWSRYWFVRNYLLVFLKNYQLKNLWKYRRIIYLRYMGIAFRMALRAGRRRESLMYARILWEYVWRLPWLLKRRIFIHRRRKREDRAVWRTGRVEEFNIYHVDGAIVLSMNALRAARGQESYTYRAGDTEFSSL